MIYTKKNLRELVFHANNLIDELKIDVHGDKRIRIVERDSEIYRDYKWALTWRDMKTGSEQPIYGTDGRGEFGSPRNAAENLIAELQWVSLKFWDDSKFRELQRRIYA